MTDRSHWVLNQPSPPNVLWSRVNMAEAAPGVLSPLAWTFWRDTGERANRRNMFRLGAFPRRELGLPERDEERSFGVFYGRLAVNVDVSRIASDCVPGMSGSAFERQLFGSARPDVPDQPQRLRYPFVLLKAPRVVIGLRAELRRLRSDTDAWWRATTADLSTADRDTSRRAFGVAVERFERALGSHILGVMVTTALYDKVAALAASTGHDGAEMHILASHDELEEQKLVQDLWAVSAGALSLPDFLARHGYHGEDEGSLHGRSWREDPTPVTLLAEKYKDMDADSALLSRAGDARRAQEAAIRDVVDSLPRRRRYGANSVIRMARGWLPYREVGKAAFLQALDVGRAAARRVGELLAEAGELDDAEDVFMLTCEELVSGTSPSIDEIRNRRELFEQYRMIEIPKTFVGEPEPTPLGESAARLEGGTSITGIGASPGIAVARARVIVDRNDADEITAGEILVCPMTDPSWSPFYVIAGGLVVDVGSALSHGAIVAREMGVPCVINTEDGTRRIRTGDLLELDGGAGTVTVLERADAAADG